MPTAAEMLKKLSETGKLHDDSEEAAILGSKRKRGRKAKGNVAANGSNGFATSNDNTANNSPAPASDKLMESKKAGRKINKRCYPIVPNVFEQLAADKRAKADESKLSQQEDAEVLQVAVEEPNGRTFNASVDGILDGNGVAASNRNIATNITALQSKPIKKEPETEVKEESYEELDTVDSVECVHAGNQLSYHFEAPNDAFIRSTLQKFNVPFNRQALLFWAQVSYTVIPATSTPTSTFEISSSDDSFFKCLSCFFTGNQNKYICVKAGIQAYFYNNFKTFGNIDGIDFSKLDVTSDQFQQLYECKEITNVHFNIICSWLKCRIGIYSSAHLEKYGSWNEESHPILLMQNENGFFKPVLSLI